MIYGFGDVLLSDQSHALAMAAPTTGIPNRIATIGINVLSTIPPPGRCSPATFVTAERASRDRQRTRSS